MKTAIIVFFFLASSFRLPLETKTAKADKEKSSITYHMKHPLHSFSATSKSVESIIQYDVQSRNILKVAVLAKVSSFDSENSNRDSHMIEVVEGIRYPNITFSSTSIVPKGEVLQVKGNLVFHGITREISFEASQTESNNHKIIKGSFSVLLGDFKIERPSLMMMQVDDELKIDFSMDFPL